MLSVAQNTMLVLALQLADLIWKTFMEVISPLIACPTMQRSLLVPYTLVDEIVFFLSKMMIIKLQEEQATIFLKTTEVSEVILSFLYSNLRFDSPNSPFLLIQRLSTLKKKQTERAAANYSINRSQLAFIFETYYKFFNLCDPRLQNFDRILSHIWSHSGA